MAYGPRRPDWARQGAPTLREMALMRAHRRGLRAGYWSVLLTPRPAGEDERRSVPQRSSEQRIQQPLMPRPPGMTDDHPLVLGGTYR